MKKITLLILAFVLVFSIVCSYAGRKVVKIPLQDLTLSTIVDVEYIRGSFQSEGIAINHAADENMALVMDLSNGASMQILWQYSENDRDYYTPENTMQSLALTRSSHVYASSSMVFIDPEPTDYIRFEFSSPLGSLLTKASLIYVEEK